MVDGAGNFLAHHRAHRAADELEVHGRHHQRLAGAQAVGGAHGVAQAGVALGGGHTLRVGLGIHELQRVTGGEVGVHLRKLAVIEEEIEVVGRVNPVVVLAGVAHEQQALVLGHRHHGLAIGALVPEAVGGLLFVLGGRHNALFYALEPGHLFEFMRVRG